MADHNIIRCGLVGYGRASSIFHAPLIAHLSESFRLTHVVERSTNIARKHYPHVQHCSSLDELLATDVHLVIVATPPASHYGCVRSALLAGKHVVCEKPFTVTSAEAYELETLAQSKGVMLTVFHSRRWDGDFLTLRRVIDAEVLGELVEFECRLDRYRPLLKPGDVWRQRDQPGSGVLADLGCDLIDQALQLFGRPSAVFADIRRQRKPDSADDYFHVDFRYENRPGFKVTLRAGCVVLKPGPRYAAHGFKGSFVKHGVDVQMGQLKAGENPSSVGWGMEPPTNWGILSIAPSYDGDDNTDNADSHKPDAHLVVNKDGVVESSRGCCEVFYAGVAEAVLWGKEPPVLPSEAALVVAIIELARESAKSGKVMPVPSAINSSAQGGA